jgi:hypothetical protein
MLGKGVDISLYLHNENGSLVLKKDGNTKWILRFEYPFIKVDRSL